MRVVIYPSRFKSSIEEKEGKLSKQKEEDKLMRSVLEGEKTEDGKLLRDAINNNLFSFNPDLMFENIVKNYSLAEKIYGKSFLRNLVDDDDNLNLPEVRQNLKHKIKKRIENLEDGGFLNKELEITKQGLMLASLSLYKDELDNLTAKGLIGEKVSKEKSHYGEKQDFRNYKKGDRYKDISMRKSLRTALRRSHKDLEKEDLKTSERESKGKIFIIYALDASGSMKGEKLDMCKKAGVALAYKAINEKDKVGLIVFGSKIETVVHPTNDFNLILENIIKIMAKKDTNIKETILKAIELFPRENFTKHLTLITDAVPTIGDKPEEETLEAVNKAVNSGITISLVGINLDEKGKKLGEKISQLGKGKFYVANNIGDLDEIVLMDYYSL